MIKTQIFLTIGEIYTIKKDLTLLHRNRIITLYCIIRRILQPSEIPEDEQFYVHQDRVNKIFYLYDINKKFILKKEL